MPAYATRSNTSSSATVGSGTSRMFITRGFSQTRAFIQTPLTDDGGRMTAEELFYTRAQKQNRNGNMAHDLFGDAAKNETTDARASMRRKRNQINIARVG